MLTTDADNNYERFLADAIATGCLWGLQNNSEGWALCASGKYKDTQVLPFWSQPEYAEIHCQEGEWADYEPMAIALDEFLDDWLPGMHEDVLLVGINWDAELTGNEYEPLDLLEAFEQVLSSG